MKTIITKAVLIGMVFACAGALFHMIDNQWPLFVKTLCAAPIGIFVWAACYLIDTRLRTSES